MLFILKNPRTAIIKAIPRIIWIGNSDGYIIKVIIKSVNIIAPTTIRKFFMM
jgi:hypothetical protein